MLPVTGRSGQVGSLQHESHLLADLFGPQGPGLALVRPDGYLGWLGRSADALIDYLRAELFVDAPAHINSWLTIAPTGLAGPSAATRRCRGRS